MTHYFKKIIFPIFGLILLYLTVEMMRQLLHAQANELDLTANFFLSFLLTLYITGMFAFPGFAYPTHQALAKSYYQIKNPKRLTRIFNLLKVEYFRKGILFAFWGKEKNRKKYFNGTRDGLRNFIYQSKQSEFGHLAAGVTIFLCSIVLLIKGFWMMFILMNIINLIGNLYPVILQRHHRIRIGRLEGRL